MAEVLSRTPSPPSGGAHRKRRHSVLDRVTGERFLAEILAVGGARPALESFKAFRGREPSVDALLRHSGMIPA